MPASPLLLPSPSPTSPSLRSTPTPPPSLVHPCPRLGSIPVKGRPRTEATNPAWIFPVQMRECPSILDPVDAPRRWSTHPPLFLSLQVSDVWHDGGAAGPPSPADGGGTRGQGGRSEPPIGRLCWRCGDERSADFGYEGRYWPPFSIHPMRQATTISAGTIIFSRRYY